MGAFEGKVFRSGNGAAVSLPDELGLAIGTEVLMKRIGDRIELTLKADPVEEKNRLRELVEALRKMGAITPVEAREQPEAPDRPGL